MNSITAKRLQGIGEYYFSSKLREIDELNRVGKDIINLGIGSPDLAPHPTVIKILQEESLKSNAHAYQSYKGSFLLREAFSTWYRKFYDVTINPENEVLPLMGSKEGIMHICMTYLNNGDDVLIPNPGYPTYSSAVKLAGANCIYYDLTEENSYYPDFKALENYDLTKVKLMWVNYPHMPTGKKASKELFENLVAFAQKHTILLCHDNPYSFILNEEPLSLLSIKDAKQVVIELNSLSKSHNMAGWRVGMIGGAKERIEEILRFKSNMDSGMFLPLQLAAARALSLDKQWFKALNDTYQIRREKVFQLLDKLNCAYTKDQAGMFVWAKVAEKYKDGYALSDEVLYNNNVLLTPGGIFGTAGERYIRVSLCATIEKFQEAINRISK